MHAYLYPLILTVHLLVGAGVIVLVLLQHGKGADMGAAFGGGASGSLFGSSGSANFLSRTTAVLATVFFLTSLTLSYMASNRAQPAGGSVLDQVPAQTTQPADVPVPSAKPATTGDASKEAAKAVANETPSAPGAADIPQ